LEEGIKRSWKESLIAGLVRNLASNSFQKRPYFPDLLNQPDLLVVPQVGRLLAIFAYLYRVSWHSVLASLEDLIETKLYVGEHTVVAAFLVAEGDGHYGEMVQLLANTFDSFRILDSETDTPTDGLDGVEPKVVLKELLSHEREQVRLCLRGFNEMRYEALVEKEHAPQYHPRELRESVSYRLRDVLDIPGLVDEVLIPNVKGYLFDPRRRYSFEFDFGIPGHPDRAIQVLRSGRYGSRNRIRYLMTKGRLLRYGLDGDQLRPRQRDFRPILIVDGNIAGPDHDPYRYVRALVSVGWDILRSDQLNELPEMI
jgi:hypothetical protein